ncbi:hypothetical protein RM704_37705 [Streptomyces sp. DSM 3412]|uniref:Uncharacterized protein n=1 Tax=Streptomyces gottesmaniae TaxID=3075518 RepID=A0ABU2Z961_9ACTN|nr:hypothetical protein [Streptomyces sp. DSM 3412]MDT0573127.1 hypothetical protein [Streptomyces sp. DSM 3412]
MAHLIAGRTPRQVLDELLALKISGWPGRWSAMPEDEEGLKQWYGGLSWEPLWQHNNRQYVRTAPGGRFRFLRRGTGRQPITSISSTIWAVRGEALDENPRLRELAFERARAYADAITAELGTAQGQGAGNSLDFPVVPQHHPRSGTPRPQRLALWHLDGLGSPLIELTVLLDMGSEERPYRANTRIELHCHRAEDHR